MKIVHIITRLIVGGAQENTLLSCEGQHDDGHEVTLITGPAIGPEGSLMDRAQSYGYRVEVIDEMRRSPIDVQTGLGYSIGWWVQDNLYGFPEYRHRAEPAMQPPSSAHSFRRHSRGGPF